LALIRFKRGATAGIVPTGLTYGEPAVNVADQILYVGGVDGEPIPIGGGGAGSQGPTGNGVTGFTVIGNNLYYWYMGPTGATFGELQNAGSIAGGVETRWSNPLPTTATNLAGVPAGTTFDIGTTAVAILERILYPYQNVSFTTLSNGLATTYELGQTASGTPGSKTVSWGTTGPTANWVSNSGRISYSGFVSGTLATNFELYDYDSNPFANSASVSYPALRATSIGNNTLTVSITGQQVMGDPLLSRTDAARWWSKMYWGKSVNDDLKNPFALIDGITGGLLITTTSSTSRSITAGASDAYFYLFVHDYYELTSMTLAGFDVSLREPIGSGITTHSVANAQGFTADYKIYRSQFQLPGNLTIGIAYGPD
jgi:hypothetical protein